ncbi:hypothetical protein BDQ17DRAFT_1350090, partial [Cyathus striatus]
WQHQKSAPPRNDASSAKRSAPLTQTTSTSFNKGEGRKRTITSPVEVSICFNDAFLLLCSFVREHDLTVVEALRQRVLELEDELEGQPAAKRAKTTAPASANAVASGSGSASANTAATTKAEEKKRRMQIKKIYDRLKKECKSDNVKFQGIPKTIKFDEVYEHSEFETIFNGAGDLVQPTPTNKPKSTVTIITLVRRDQVLRFFGDEFKGLKGCRWTRGGAPTFEKSKKMPGTVEVVINSLDVNYSKNGMKCSLNLTYLKRAVLPVAGYSLAVVVPKMRATAVTSTISSALSTFVCIFIQLRVYLISPTYYILLTACAFSSLQHIPCFLVV